MIREYPLDRPALAIGRHEGNDIVIDHMGVSGRHILTFTVRRAR